MPPPNDPLEPALIVTVQNVIRDCQEELGTFNGVAGPKLAGLWKDSLDVAPRFMQQEIRGEMLESALRAEYWDLPPQVSEFELYGEIETLMRYTALCKIATRVAAECQVSLCMDSTLPNPGGQTTSRRQDGRELEDAREPKSEVDCRQHTRKEGHAQDTLVIS